MTLSESLPEEGRSIQPKLFDQFKYHIESPVLEKSSSMEVMMEERIGNNMGLGFLSFYVARI